MSQNQGVIRTVWTFFFPADPRAAEIKEIADRERQIRAMLKGQISPKRALNRRSKTPVRAKVSPSLNGRLEVLHQQRRMANQRWLGRKLNTVAGWLGRADLPVRFVAASLQQDPNLSFAERTIRSIGMTFASKAKAVATALVITTLVTLF